MIAIRANIVSPPRSPIIVSTFAGRLPFRRLLSGIGQLLNVVCGLAQGDGLASVRQLNDRKTVEPMTRNLP
jgi:hypothetical protein